MARKRIYRDHAERQRAYRERLMSLVRQARLAGMAPERAERPQALSAEQFERSMWCGCTLGDAIAAAAQTGAPFLPSQYARSDAPLSTVIPIGWEEYHDLVGDREALEQQTTPPTSAQAARFAHLVTVLCRQGGVRVPPGDDEPGR